MYEHGFLAPVVALIVWSLVMLVWLYATRIPAMRAGKVRAGDATKDQMEALPQWARRPADNYNHLMEQPTIFYAVCFVLQFLGITDPHVIGWAWAYVVLRVLHSLLQGTLNIIMLRFLIFLTASVCLGVLAFHAAIGVGIADWF